MKTTLLIGVLFFSLSLFSQEKDKPLEKLTYTGYYNWGFVWIKAGSVEFTLTPSDKYPNAQRLFAVGSSNPSWDWVFKLRDTLISYHDSLTFMPYEFSRKAHEGNYHKTFDYVWNYDNDVIYSEIERIGKYVRKDTIPLQEGTYDMLSVAWLARNLDFAKYKKNDMIPIRILIDEKIYELYVRYLGRDKVKTGKGKRSCHVFSPLLVEGEVFKGGENMKIWVSDDEYRVPVMVEAKILVGSVKGILDEANSVYW
ncbi:DUF3108 domain-containing protein [Gabonibacter chumensis]|uniref:DUF3108 domain-containing protein n=1 Tax=Gabonibacter chumensis TaxID=2972474 RepID=UPI0025726442|nr:DUF3108 domain-containing protein [Gabonibacter chumensis]MCR9011562.1 DUF3108 domain-containing protein [Gabonibacter chumensis]